MEQELWLARDDTTSGWYEAHGESPDKDEHGKYWSNAMLWRLASTTFHNIISGARLRKGRKKRIKRIVIELGD